MKLPVPPAPKPCGDQEVRPRVTFVVVLEDRPHVRDHRRAANLEALSEQAAVPRDIAETDHVHLRVRRTARIDESSFAGVYDHSEYNEAEEENATHEWDSS